MIFQLKAKWNGKFICHLCRASRRDADGMCFTRFGALHHRRSCAEVIVECMPPDPSPLVLVPGWDPVLIRYCSMHTLALGIVQNANAESLLWMFENRVHTDTADLDVHLRHSYVEFKRWLSRSGLSCSGRAFNSKRLHMNETDFPYLAYKAFNGRIVLAWAASTLCSGHVQTKIKARKAGESDLNYLERMCLNGVITSCVLPCSNYQLCS